MTFPPLLDPALAAPSAKPLLLKELPNWPESHHVFDEDSIWAVNAALMSGRPLLLRGEPGSGKSQLARAAAQALKWPFLSRVVNARFEPEDLLYRFDAVARLAKAQILSRTEEVKGQLDALNFLVPEALWWALNHESACKQFERAAPNCGEAVDGFNNADCGFEFTKDTGVVVLIDEIDKADSEVPNSLLETLSIGRFHLPYGGASVKARDIAPLIIITTNEDREMPAAFLRRCLVHQMDLPKDAEKRVQHLKIRVRAHFLETEVSDAICEDAIAQLEKDRKEMEDQDLKPPGQAELLDLIRAVSRLATGDVEQQKVLEKIRNFAFRKHRL